MKTIIYGASDDLIEVEGHISEEVNPPSGGVYNIKCSDGTHATIEYGGGDGSEWKIKLKKTGDKFLRIVDSIGDTVSNEHTDEDCKGCASYSDVLIMADDLDWVKIHGTTLHA